MRFSKKQKEVLSVIGKSLVLATALLAPNIVQVLRPKSSKEKYRYNKTIKKMFDDKIIYLFGEEVRLTKKGRELLGVIQTEDISIEQPEEWDGVWHVICYDIPENKKKARDYFRLRLTELGFIFIQDSLWVYPYPCKEEVAIIAQNLGIASFVAILNTDYLPGQLKLMRHFKIHR